MNRKLFLTLASVIALAFGSFAFFQPALLLQSKGVVLDAAANVWMQEAGIALISIGVAAFLLRGQLDSPALRAFRFCCNHEAQRGPALSGDQKASE